MNTKINKIINKQIYDFLTHTNNTKTGLTQVGGLEPTARSYVSILQEFEKFLIDYKKLDNESFKEYNFINLALDDIKAYSDFLRNHTTNKVSTHNQKLGVIRIFAVYILNTCSDNADIYTLNSYKAMLNDVRKLDLQDTPTEQHCFTKEDIITLHSAILSGNFKKKEMLLAIFLLYRDTAAKRDSVRLINISDVHLNGDAYVMIKVGGKTKTVEKHYLRQDTIKAIKDYLLIRTPKNPNEEALFISNMGGRLSTATIYRMMKELYVEAGFGYRDKDGNPITKYDINSLRQGVLSEIMHSVGIVSVKTVDNPELDNVLNVGRKLIRDSVFNYSIDYSTERRVN